MRPALIVGEAPNTELVAANRSLWLRPDSSGVPHAGNRLLEMSGLGILEFLDLFDRENVLARVAPEPWTAQERYEAHARASEIQDSIFGRPVLLLGRKVADAFGISFPIPTRFGPTLLFPHPSAASRFWNDRQRADRAVAMLREWISEIPRPATPDPLTTRGPF